MINHVRTLILNKLRGTATFPGEEYIPVDYLVRTEPTVVQKIKQIIFGGDPDRYMLNYRMYQIMTTIHATELEEYVTYHDSRLTYLPFRSTSLYSSAYQTTSTKIGTFDGELAILESLVPEELAGWLHYQWNIDVIPGNLVAVKRLKPSIIEDTYEYTMTEGRSNAIPFTGSSLKFTFSGPVGAEWAVESVAKPQRNFATIFTALSNGITEVDELALFGVAPAEPVLSFKNLWQDHEEYAYRFGALMLGVAWLMHEQTAA
jgi:hypothetical protein